MRFSGLADEFPGTTNRLYQRVQALRDAEIDFVDLVRGSVHDAGIVFPDDVFRNVLAAALDPARVYRPDSMGQPVARDVVAVYERNSVDRILLTPGTSVSYWYVFRLLAEAGDEILCPAPSYPLFDYIARMTGVRLTSYHLDESRAWRIDFDSLESAIGERTRAVVLISPHNPTGMVATREEADGLAALARRHDLAIIADEVFREFVFEAIVPARLAETDAPLVFTLNGFSKMFALPGMKIGWISISGDPEPVSTAVRTLEMMSDTFLPVSEIAQFSVPGVFANGQEFLAGYRERIRVLREAAAASLGPSGWTAPEGGFYCVIPCQRDVEEDDLALEILDDARVLVHPGYFYDIEGKHIVCSFVGDPKQVHTGFRSLGGHLAPDFTRGSDTHAPRIPETPRSRHRRKKEGSAS
jgi:alanine-synthesizing transaminase